MKIKQFIQQEVLLPRLRERGVLVVYDPDRRYQELCRELAAANRCVVDAGMSSLESREQAQAALLELGKRALEGLLVYVPARPPRSDEDKQRDPFAVYGACGKVFPEGDGDEYPSLCLKARADHATEIRRIFAENASPSFEVIDAVGGGAGWPHLQALLQVESARDLLFALLAPAEAQAKALKGQDAWVAEARDLFQRGLDLKLQTRGKTWTSVADELWRFVLFSEFAFDVPGPLPPALTDVPRAGAEARPLVEDICERLRSDRRTRAAYIDRAEKVEKELNLPAACAGIRDLGTRDTFAFEERATFTRAVEALARDNLDAVRQILRRHTESVWVNKGENQAQWLLLQAAARLVQRCGDAERQLPEHTASQDALLNYYVGGLREIDRLQREFEQAAADCFDTAGDMERVLGQARAAYRRLVSRVQDVFVRHLERSGWPPTGRLANADVFDRLVAPRLLESGRRVAYLLIDALRYELGVELEKQLTEDGQVEVQPAFAQLPTVTPVGMASLLPGAGQSLRLTRKDGTVVPVLGDQPLTNVTQRLEVLRKAYGERFGDTTLVDFVRGKAEVPAGVELLVIRSNEMDSHLEANPETTLSLIYGTLKQIRVAVHKLAGLGFKDAVIVTDHGFFLNTGAGPGDVCPRPNGTWVNLHERCLLGAGAPESSSYLLPAAQLGIRGDFSQVSGPRGMVAYRAGELYFHGGASLQEAVVPVLLVRLRPPVDNVPQRPPVTLRYKRGAKRITTRLPVVEVSVENGDLFAAAAPVEILLEAHDRKNNVVGEAKPGGPVNQASRVVFVRPGETIAVTLRMGLDFEGKFTVKALDPTTLTAYGKLDLETDYTV